MSSLDISKALVTGGAGFIGSHIVDNLVNATAAQVVVYDNFCTGQELFIQHHRDNDRVEIVEGDTLDLEKLKSSMAGVDTVFHFQANADVRGGIENRRLDLEQNTIATWNALEAAKEAGAKRFVFASSATVYGEPEVFPTPEDCATTQTSLYGASKLSGEAMIQAYSEYFGIQSFIFRFVSWTGERYSHGVVYDFLKKLKDNPKQLEILGNGKQKKSYLDVSDGVRGIFTALAKAPDLKNVFNLGHDEVCTVIEVADAVCDEIGLNDVEYVMTGGERGWIGDSPLVQLDTTRMKNLGWAPNVTNEASLRRTAAYLQQHPQINR